MNVVTLEAPGEPVPPRMPRGLKAAGKALWRSIIPEFTLRPDEVAVLADACRTADIVARLDEALVDAPLTVTGSAKQVREHPLLSERRQQAAHLARLLHQLRLTDDEDEALTPAERRRRENRSARGRKAANARWREA